ncbi:MAG: DNA replication protein [Pseudorhodoplanes sp.]|nr:DNA replication protein [Pseudorhodoplanes sp.]
MTALAKSSLRLLRLLAEAPVRRGTDAAAEQLIACDLAVRQAGGALAITEAGRAHLARRGAATLGSTVDPFLSQHLTLASADVMIDGRRSAVTIDEGESPVAWLARRKGKDGRALIEPHHLLAAERFREDFTRAHLMPRTTANWEAPIARDRRSDDRASFSDLMIASRQRVQHALKAVGPEFSGLLLDVCCFLKRLEDVERERGWPARSAKVVLQLGLARLARHYGLEREISGRRARLQAWSAPQTPSAGAEPA